MLRCNFTHMFKGPVQDLCLLAHPDVLFHKHDHIKRITHHFQPRLAAWRFSKSESKRQEAAASENYHGCFSCRTCFVQRPVRVSQCVAQLGDKLSVTPDRDQRWWSDNTMPFTTKLNHIFLIFNNHKEIINLSYTSIIKLEVYLNQLNDTWTQPWVCRLIGFWQQWEKQPDCFYLVVVVISRGGVIC